MQKRAIGFIPLRKNSKAIPGKNKKKMLGRPMFSWVLNEAIFSDLEMVYVFTDDLEIIDYIKVNYAWSDKVKALVRSDGNATDTASTEAAMLEFSNLIEEDYDILTLLQATSPLTNRNDINNALSLLAKPDYHSVLSVVRSHRFIWSEDGTPINYDYSNRPRRQDFKGLLMENGAIYATEKEAFLKSKNRLSGSIGLVEMAEETLIELDSPADWAIIERLLMTTLRSNRMPQRLKFLVLDVDGVFTDGRVSYDRSGEFSKTFDLRDGMGLEILRQNGIEVMVMTSEDSKIVRQRMKKLKIRDVFHGVKDKFSLLDNIMDQRKISPNEIAYIGDDVNDMANMLRVGWSFCPANATKTIKYHADLVLNNSSAQAAIREACEFILQYNSRFNNV